MHLMYNAILKCCYLTLIYHATVLLWRIYSAFHGPLAPFPGPKIRAISSLPKIISLVRGTDHLDYVALHAQYGPIVRIAPNELSFAGGASAFKDVLGFKKAGQPGFPKERIFYGGGFFKENTFLINADDAEHAKLRRVVSHAFADKSLRDVEPMLLRWAQKLVLKLTELAEKGEEVNMVKYFNCTTFDIMGDLAFNENLGMLDAGDEDDWVKAFTTGAVSGTIIRAMKSTGWIAQWFVDSVLSKQAAALPQVQSMVNYVYNRLDRRLQRNPEHPDLWTQILIKGVGLQELSDDEQKGLAFLFMVAGTETTSSALSGIMYYLLTNRSALQRLTNEVRSAFSTINDINLEVVARLPYTQAVISEGLRMYPPVPSTLPRVSPAGGGMVCGTYIPGNVVCGVHHLSTYRSSEHFKDAFDFRPERWLSDPAYKDDHLDAVEPFHVGPRNCVGKNLALHEIRLLLVALMLTFDFELIDRSRDWVEQSRVYTTWAKAPLWCNLRLSEK